MVAPETREVLGALTADGAEARFVGGCVRDAILGREVKDIDIATTEPPDRVIDRLGAAGVKVVPTGLKHGTVTAIVRGVHFEITTLRHDVETYGRHAKVAFTDDWSADAARRDFTINAMFCAPDGTLFDPFGGYGDLLAGRVRFVGSAAERIREDVLRLLRFYRFTAYYGTLPLDPEGRDACRKLAHFLPGLSAERVRAETLRLLAAPDPAPIVEVMAADGVFGHYLPEARLTGRLRALVRLERSHGPPDRLRRLAALLDVDGAGAEAAARRLRLSNVRVRRLTAIAELVPGFRPPKTSKARRRWFYRRGAALFRDVALVHWAGRRRAKPEHYVTGLAEADRWRPVTLPVGGSDVRALGVSAGPGVGQLLDRIEKWWIEGDFRATRTQALAKLRSFLKDGAISGNRA